MIKLILVMNGVSESVRCSIHIIIALPINSTYTFISFWYLQGSEDNACDSHDNQMPESTNGNTIAMTTIRTAPSSPCSILQS